MSMLIRPCQTPRCPVSIRTSLDQPGLPICRWCQKNASYYATRTHPDGMPHPLHPWPWLSDSERDRRVRMPHNQERFRQYPEQYARWIQNKP